MKLSRILPLAGVSSLALASALYAQDTARTQNDADTTILLAPITLIAAGQESVEATGGAVVSQEDIEAMQPADVSELFSRESAVAVSGGAGPAKRIYVFGIEQSNLAVTVDGVPQGVTSWHHTGSNVLDPAFLKSVEVEAGAATADAGFAAAAGAVRYETLGARDLLRDGRSQGGRVALSYGSNGRGLSGSLAGYGVHGGLDWFAMIHATDGDDYESGDGLNMDGTSPKALGGLFKLGYEFDGHRVELGYDYSRDDADRTIKMNMDLYGSGIDRGTYPMKISRNTLSLKYSTTAPTDRWDPEARLYISRNDYWRPDYAMDSTNGDMDLESRTIGGVLQNTFTLGRGNVTAGVDWSHDDYDIDNYGDTDRQYWSMETMQIGAFVQGRFEFDNGIDLSTGLRVDHHRFTDWNGRRRSDTGASVNGTLSYEFAQGYEVFAGASHSWMGYNFGEYALLHARTRDLYVEDGFEPASARNYKIGLNASQGNWTGNVTYFDTRIKDLGEYDVDGQYDTDPATAPFLTNGDEIRSKGFTLQGNYSWGSGRAGASFTKADVTEDGEDRLPNGGVASPIGKMATLFIDQEIPQYNLKIGGNVEWADSLDNGLMRAAGFSEHSSYTVLNLYGEWRPQNYDNIVVNLNVDNLFDRDYYERSSFVQQTRGTRQIDPLYAPGRTVSLGVKMDF
ncbi:hemoglobin/transferrin/lactoferrin receptor protein [Paracoccus halophilus]|uniref:Hemoglobin/transferrin/lactoferrin receptor protein n=1 Tax=Paracoccus halophilus TaxID=376733 RepID=A0A099F2C7_9RHOB|nr:TonB-dependent receptor [Paracoccus halophilus]KGJ04342.1 ligand-gated channel [Paracoccus halophilus]SFA55242.1 hemoglobin/transferrin/lactoferrin receptor protein [Paracoccus halophilus]